MVDVIRKALLTGVGLAVLTKEKAEEVAREFARTAELSGDKGKEFVDEVVSRSEKARKDLEATIERYVAEALHRMNIPTRHDVAQLSDRIAELERMLADKGQSQ